MEDVTKHGNCTKAVTIYGSFGSDVNKHTFPNKEMLLSVVPRPLSAGRDTASSLSHSAFYDRISGECQTLEPLGLVVTATRADMVTATLEMPRSSRMSWAAQI